MGTITTTMADAIFSKVQQRVLALLFVNPDQSFYTNEIVRAVNAGVGAVQRELGKLESSGLALVKKTGNQKHYQANRNAPIFDELRNILIKTSGLADVLRLALAPINQQIQMAFIYGSIAKGSDTAQSDIDLMLIGKNLAYADVFARLSACEAPLGRPVNPSIYTPEEWQHKLNGENNFITQVLAQAKVFLIGSEDDLTTLGHS